MPSNTRHRMLARTGYIADDFNGLMLVNPLTYEKHIRNINPDNLIGLWPLYERIGNTAFDKSKEHNNATYLNATLNSSIFLTGSSVPRFDGTGDTINISSIISDFNVLEFTISCWIRVFDSSVWTDGVDRRIVNLLVDGNNFIFLRKASANNSINVIYDAGGTVKQVQTGSQTSTDWIHLALTVSKSNDRLRSYINGVQVGSTQTALGTWAGTISSVAAAIGSANSSGSANVFNGWLAYCSIWKTELTGSNIATIYNTSGFT